MTTATTTISKALAASQSAIITNPEHCSIDENLLRQLGCAQEDQVRVTLLNSNIAQTKALYTIVGVTPTTTEGGLRLGQSGREKLGGTTSLVGAPVLLSWPPAHPTMSDAEASNTPGGEFVERVSDDGLSAKLLVMAPHGGSIEAETDHQAVRVAATLALKGASSWRCSGWRPGGGSRCWHITATEISQTSFPLLQTLRPRGFVYTVAFHGFSGTGILIGGGAEPELQHAIADAIKKVLVNVPVIVAKSGDPLGAANPRNIVNSMAIDGNGVQIEQSLLVRGRYAVIVADAVASVFDARIP